MERIRRNIYLSLLLHLVGVAVVLQSDIIADTVMERLIHVSLLEEKVPLGIAGEKILSPAMPVRKADMQSGVKVKAPPRIEKKQEDSSAAPVLQRAVRPDSRTESAPAPADNVQSLPDGIGAGNKPASPSTGTPSGTYPSSGTVISSTDMRGADSGTEAKGELESLDSYRQIIRSALQKNLVYPYVARKRRMEGTARVEFRINQTGMPEDIRIVESSGHSLLDTAAKETVVRASPFPVPGKTIEIPITFLLRDN